MFGYINTGKLNIRIHREIEGPPNNPSPARMNPFASPTCILAGTGINKMWFWIVDMISEFEGIRRNYTDSREQQD
jgi:hypothetical protein